MVDNPKNINITVSQICANIFVKYFTDVIAVCDIFPLTYCFMAIPQATILKIQATWYRLRTVDRLEKGYR